MTIPVSSGLCDMNKLDHARVGPYGINQVFASMSTIDHFFIIMEYNIVVVVFYIDGFHINLVSCCLAEEMLFFG